LHKFIDRMKIAKSGKHIKNPLVATLYVDNTEETADLHIQQNQEFRLDDFLVLKFKESNVETIKN